MSNDCLFCKIIAGEIPSAKVYEDDAVLAFKDIQPQAPVHILLIPKVHFDNAYQASAQQPEIFAKVFAAIRNVVEQQGLVENGYRVVINTGKDGNQTVEHLHFHLLGGRALGWPPG